MRPSKLEGKAGKGFYPGELFFLAKKIWALGCVVWLSSFSIGTFGH